MCEGFVFAREVFCEAEVKYFYEVWVVGVFCEEYVCWFEVSVDDAESVGFNETSADLFCDGGSALFVDGSVVADVSMEGVSVEEFHREVVDVVLCVSVVEDRYGVLVSEFGCD